MVDTDLTTDNIISGTMWCQKTGACGDHQGFREWGSGSASAVSHLVHSLPQGRPALCLALSHGATPVPVEESWSRSHDQEVLPRLWSRELGSQGEARFSAPKT